jgi:hypothetical protein
MRRTTAVSIGCNTLVRLLTTVLPGATATMSSRPKIAHSKAMQKKLMISRIVQRSVGDAGASISSRCAGRNASSSEFLCGASRLVRVAQAALNASV